MELPTIINVKSEKDLETEKENHFLDFHLDIKIESEAPQILEDYDWCIEDEVLSPANTDTYRESGDFEQLTQLLKQQCTRCDRYFVDRYSLLQHNLTHLKIYLIQCTYLLKYKCPICNIFYNTKDKLKEHTTVIHGSKYNIEAKYNKSFYLETLCDATSEDKSLSKQRNTSDSDESLLVTKSLRQKCSESFELETLCDETFEEKTLSNQSNTSDSDDNSLVTKSLRQCTECGKIFTYKSWFSHMRSVHSSAKSICQICKKTFKCDRYLRRHMLYGHGNVKPSWRFHKITDNIEIKCEKCPAVFVNKNSLKTHTRNCHTESVECKLCKSKLKSKSYLLAHMRRVHYDDGKEHKCKMCEKKFKSPRYVKIHMKNKHGVC